MKSVPILILMRHAARELNGLDRLSPEGREQAMKLTKAVQEKRIPRPTRLIATPRKRSQETLKPLSDDLLLPIEVDKTCDERQKGENSDQFLERVRSWVSIPWMNQSTAADQTWLVVSHLDWLENAVQVLESDESEAQQSEPWLPASRRVYFFQDGIWRRRQ